MKTNFTFEMSEAEVIETRKMLKEVADNLICLAGKFLQAKIEYSNKKLELEREQIKFRNIFNKEEEDDNVNY